MKESKLVKILNNSKLAKSTFLLAEAADAITTYVGLKKPGMVEINPTVNYAIDNLNLENGLMAHTVGSVALTWLMAESFNKYCDFSGIKEKFGNSVYYMVGTGAAIFAVKNISEILQA